MSALCLLLLACGDRPPEQPPPVPYKRPPKIDHAADHREAMIPSLIAIGTIKRLGPEPGRWADIQWRAYRQEVEIDIEERVYDPFEVPSPLVTSVLLLPELPFVCTAPCIGAIRPDVVGHKVLIEATRRGAERIEVYASAESFVIDPTPEDVAKVLANVPPERRE